MKRKNWPQLFRPSTRLFTQEARRLRGFSLFDWIHGYVYARWPFLYIGIGTGELPRNRFLKHIIRGVKRLFSLHTVERSSRDSHMHKMPTPEDLDSGTLADNYHGKVIPLEDAKKLVTVKQEVDLTTPEQVVPFTRARDIILKNPDHIAVLECPCRASRPAPCQPLDVCLVVGEPFASFVVEHHAHRSRWISSEEAMEILQDEQKRGHVHHAFFKDAMLGRFYAICNCCSCCCGAMQAQRNGVPMLISSGYVSSVDENLCEGCGDCVEMCQFKAIAVEAKKAVVDSDRCMGCGVCVAACEKHAHSLERNPAKPAPLKIQELMGM